MVQVGDITPGAAPHRPCGCGWAHVRQTHVPRESATTSTQGQSHEIKCMSHERLSPSTGESGIRMRPGNQDRCHQVWNISPLNKPQRVTALSGPRSMTSHCSGLDRRYRLDGSGERSISPVEQGIQWCRSSRSQIKFSAWTGLQRWCRLRGHVASMRGRSQ